MRLPFKHAIKSRFPALVRVRNAIRGRSGEPSNPPEAPPAPLEKNADGDLITGFTRAEVELLMDEMVRPALESDGGNIELVHIDHGDVHVRLLGACVGCPSSAMTLQMGVERLFVEELTGFTSLIEVAA